MKPFITSTTILLLLLLSITLFAQPQGIGYVVHFTDKANSPYSIENPSAFLSEAALLRRSRQGIPVQTDDIPVNASYLQAVAATGAQIAAVSRWFNTAAVWINNPAMIPVIEALPFVSQVQPMNGSGKSLAMVNWKSKPFFDQEVNDLMVSYLDLKNISSNFYNYGGGSQQITMINGIALHNEGYRGQGMVIAVLDAGFRNVNIISAFDSLRANGRILGTKDFVLPGNNVYNPGIHVHGTNVLSIMAANLPGQMVGTAPEASYWLIRTEDADGPSNNTEYLMEEYYWVAGAEFADSVGASVINSSLGYYTFDNPAQNHTYSDMDGNTTPVTRGANHATGKGILVVNSAGNNGSSPWQYIIAPADGFQVLAVGAVKGDGTYASFSSRGPSADGRVKPDVAARGDSTVYVNSLGQVRAGNGTSYSSPVVAGMAACLWQTILSAGNTSVYQSIIRSGSQYQNPDNFLGYGIPDFQQARVLLSLDTSNAKGKGLIRIFPNPAASNLTIEAIQPGLAIKRIRISDMTGRLLIEKNYIPERQIVFENIQAINAGIYLLNVDHDKGVETLKMIKR